MSNTKIKIEYQNEDVIIDKIDGVDFFMTVNNNFIQVRIINSNVENGTILDKYFRNQPVESVKVLVNDIVVKNINNISHVDYKFNVADILYEAIEFIMKVSDVNGNN